jgi:prevent-host-death family protein
MPDMTQHVGVADAKRRFSELLDRVGAGERIVITRHGKPAVALVAPEDVVERPGAPIGLLAVVGALADWEDFEEVMSEVVASRRRARDRPAPDLG